MSSVLLLQRLLDLLDERGVQYANMMQDRLRIEEAYYFAVGQGKTLQERIAMALTRTEVSDLIAMGKALRERYFDIVRAASRLRVLSEDEKLKLEEAERTEIPMLKEQSMLVSAAQSFSESASALSGSCGSPQEQANLRYESPGEDALPAILSLLGLARQQKPTRYRREEYNEWNARERAAHRDLIALVRQAYT